MSSFMDKIKSKDFQEISKTEITADDIRKLAIYYQEILDLKEKYNSAIVGRKKIACEIREKLLLINKFLYYFDNRNKALDTEMEYAEAFISDCEKAMNLLLRLANENENKFLLKRFSTTSYASFEIMHGDREHKNICGNIWLIGEKEVLDKIDSNNYYYGSDFGQITNAILKNNHSLIILTDHYYENNVKPWNYDSRIIQKVDIKTSGMLGNISCYLYDDDLRIAVNKFLTFINQNGADIKGIDEDSLFDIIKLSKSEFDKEQAKKLVFERKDS